MGDVPGERRDRARGRASYAGGYAIWLLYGLSVGSMPLVVVDAVGLVCGGLTLAVALSLRGSLVRPSTWTSCPIKPAADLAARTDISQQSVSAKA